MCANSIRRRATPGDISHESHSDVGFEAKDNAPGADAAAKSALMPSLERFGIAAVRLVFHFEQRGFDPYPVARRDKLEGPFSPAT
jgi:hypothetical protein